MDTDESKLNVFLIYNNIYNLCLNADTHTTHYTCSYNEIFEILRDNLRTSFTQQVAIFEEKVASKLSIHFSICSDSKAALQKLVGNLYKKWQEAHRNNIHFQKKYETWLKTSVTIFVSNLINFYKTRLVG